VVVVVRVVVRKGMESGERRVPKLPSRERVKYIPQPPPTLSLTLVPEVLQDL
jgi:hypothetical protein